MALATLQLQGSCKICPLRPSSWSSGSKSRHFVELHAVVPTENFVFLKCKSCLRAGIPLVPRPKGKQLKISAYKGNGHNDEFSNGTSGSNALKSSVKLSYALEEPEGTLVESPKAKSIPISYSSVDETSTHFLSMHNLLKSWFPLPPRLPPNIAVEELVEVPSLTEISEAQSLVGSKGGSEIVKAVRGFFMSLDPTVMIPLLIFVPCFLAVNFIYGAEVSKELTPLWLLGPLVVALYTKILLGIWALYSFSLIQTPKVVKNVPTYYLLAHDYIARGQLEKDIRARLLQPLVDIKNLDYKEVSRRKLKDLQSFLVEIYLDVLESVWPYYCRSIRVLKRVQFI